MTLIDFLLARFDEDERALADIPPAESRWTFSEHLYFYGTHELVVRTQTGFSSEIAHHMARHDPARARRRIEFQRSFVEAYRNLEHQDTSQWDPSAKDALELVLQGFAYEYAYHHDFRKDWTNA